MRNVSVIPNMITTFGLSCGLFIIFKMSMTQSLAEEPEVLSMMVWLLLVAGVADVLDGAVARAVQAESEFGAFFDALSDAVTFGVAPSVIILKTLSLAPDHSWAFFVHAGAMIYSICGVLRLGRYCVMSLRSGETSSAWMRSYKRNFTGLPIPAAAGAAVSANLLLTSFYVNQWVVVSEVSRASIMTFILILLGYFMVSRLRFPSLKALQIRVPTFPLAFTTVFFAVFLFYGALYHFQVFLAVVFWGYILLALTLSFLRILAGKKSKKLKDFELEEEE